MGSAFAGAYIFIVILAVVLVICWIVLPIAVIGTKPLLRELLAEQRRTNAILEARLPDLRSRGSAPAPGVDRVEPKRIVDNFLPHELRKR